MNSAWRVPPLVDDLTPEQRLAAQRRYRWLRLGAPLAVLEMAGVTLGFNFFYYPWTPPLQRWIIAAVVAVLAAWLLSLLGSGDPKLRSWGRGITGLLAFFLGVGITSFSLLALLLNPGIFGWYPFFWIPAGGVLLGLVGMTAPAHHLDRQLYPAPAPAAPTAIDDYESNRFDEAHRSPD